MSVSYWQNSFEKKTTKHYDAVVIGAGVAGVSVCYWLNKENPKLKIALIDKQQIASGASGRNAGFVTCGSLEHFIKLEQQFGLTTALTIWKYSEANHQLLKTELLQDTPDLDYKVTGSCTVAPSEERLQDYQKYSALLKNHDLNFEMISQKDIEDEFSLKGFSGGAFYAKDGEIHPVKLLHALFKKCSVDYFPNEEVFKYMESSSSAQIHTRTEIFNAENVFVTTNADLPVLFPEFSKVLQPGRGQILTTNPIDWNVRGPCYFTKDLCYFRKLADGRLLVGGFRNLSPQTEVTSLDATTDTIQEALKKFVETRFKNTKAFSISHQWAGTMAFTTDGQPLVGKHPSRERLFVHAGCSGHGMGNNFFLAKTLVDHFHGQKVSPVLSLERFRDIL